MTRKRRFWSTPVTREIPAAWKQCWADRAPQRLRPLRKSVTSALSRRNLEYEGGHDVTRTQSLLLGVAVSVLSASVPVLTHHNFAAEFDADKPVTLKGTITRMDWINPHAWIYIEVKEA